MTALILTLGDTTLGQSNPRQYPATAAGIQSAWNAIPANCVAADVQPELVFYNDAMFELGTTSLTLSGKTTDAAHRIKLRAAAGHSYRDNPNGLTNKLGFNQANGVALRFTGSNALVLDIVNDYVTVEGLQISHSGGGSTYCAVAVESPYPNVLIDGCLIDSVPNGGSFQAVYLTNARMINSTIISRSADSVGVDFDLGSGSIENCTIVRVSDFTATNDGVRANNAFVKNCAIFGFSTAINGNAPDNYINNATSAGTLKGTGLSGLVYASQFMSTTAASPDFRLKAGSGLIDTGVAPSSDNTRAAVGSRQQGTSADIGSWEYPQAIQAPTATVTSVNITGQTVVISGTTTGSPTTGTMQIVPSGAAYNYAEAQGPSVITLGSGTFTVTFNNVKVGSYSTQFTVANSTYSVNGTNPLGSFSVIGATAPSVTQDPIDGQVLTIRGTTAGSPTSASLTVPAASNNPNGAVDQVKSVTLGSGTFTVSISIPPGNYDAGRLTFTNAAGTSLPQAGTSPISVVGFSGNPEAPGGDGSNPPATVTGVAVSPTTATGSTTFNATVSGTNSPSQAVSWSATAGTISSGGIFTAPAATGSVQTITVTATSIVDSTKSGTATVTIAASTGSTVTGVSVSPSTATVNGGSTRQFSATVSGTNSPSQSVSWSANGGSVSSSGLFTAPVATTSAQTFTVTATSVADGSKSGSATITVPSLAAAARTVTMPLATGLDIFNQPIPAANLSGLSVAIYAQSTPGSASTALYQTETGTTNGSGVFSASFQTLLQAGALVLVVILMPDGRHCASKVAIA